MIKISLNDKVTKLKEKSKAKNTQDKILTQGLKQISEAIAQLDPQTCNGVEFFKTQGT